MEDVITRVDLMQPAHVLDFWFKEIDSFHWWVKDIGFDRTVDHRFYAYLEAAKEGLLAHWRETPEGCLAEIMVLDQFSRNIYRNKPQSFAADEQALNLSLSAIDKGFNMRLDHEQRTFLYMPLLHSESLKIHEKAVELFSHPDLKYNLEFEKHHKRIIERFGRYPHRNQVLGRESTEAEVEFLLEPGVTY